MCRREPTRRPENARACAKTEHARKLVLAVACALGLAGPTAASEFCVTCSNPNASYACTVDNQIGAAGDAALKLFCITEIAKAGGHSSCAVDKAKVAPCEGQKHALKVPGGFDELIPGAGSAPVTGAAPPASGTSPPAAASPAAGTAPGGADTAHGATTTIPKTSPPATVEQAVKDSAQATEEGLEQSGQAVSDAAKSAGNAIEKAGSAVGDAAKKSWNCLKSLFSEC